MKLINKYSNKEMQSLNNIGIKIKDKDYSKSDCRVIERQIEEYIMGCSTKTGEIPKLQNEFSGILSSLISYQKDSN